MINKRDPRLLGFIVGFGGVTLVGLVAIIGWSVLSGSPAPTLVPTVVPAAERITIVATAEEALANTSTTATPLPSSPTSTPLPSPTRSASIEYMVKEGDTLFDIALAYGVSVETIQAANDLQGETITPEQILIIPPGPLPTSTPYVEGDYLVHTVSSGETLISIAEHYGVSVEALQTANDLNSEIIQAGWRLQIPTKGTLVTTTTTTTTADLPWQPSILRGDLTAAYPLTLENERFTMHYQPDTPAGRAPNRVAEIVEAALTHIESKLAVKLEQPFDVYVAGSLFAPPDLALRGRSFSSQRRNFYLYDGTGTPAERRYLITHELTHLVIWNSVSRPSSVMLHEGVAVYTGVEAMQAADFIPLFHFCAAYQQAGQLPRLTGGRDYLGHIRDLDLYFAAGCFVQNLIETRGIESFKQLFASGDYSSIYGRTLTQLEAEWLEHLETVADDLTFDPDDLVTAVTRVTEAYDRLFTDFDGTPSQIAAYRELDQARIAALQGRFEEAQGHLEAFEVLLANE